MSPAEPAPRRIGILGGMGPAAAIDLQAKVLAATPAATDREHLPVVVWNVPQVPDRVAAVLGTGPSPLPAMIEGARALEAAGCEAFAVACNTAHHWAGELAASVGIPLLHIADAAVDALARRPVPPMRVGLLATRGTLAAAFYGERLARHGFDWIVPTDEEQDRFVAEAIARVKAGDTAGALAVHLRLLQLFKAIFVTVNPVPVKYALNRMGIPVGGVRPPLVEVTEKEAAVVDTALRGLNLI